MPFELTWEPRGIYRRYHGDVAIAERRHSLELICGDPRFDDLRYAITHYLDVQTYEISRQATTEIAALHIAPLRTNPDIVVAAVAVDEKVIEEIRHFISLGFISQPYRVFATVQAARACVVEQTRAGERAP